MPAAPVGADTSGRYSLLQAVSLAERGTWRERIKGRQYVTSHLPHLCTVRTSGLAPLATEVKCRWGNCDKTGDFKM